MKVTNEFINSEIKKHNKQHLTIFKTGNKLDKNYKILDRYTSEDNSECILVEIVEHYRKSVFGKWETITQMVSVSYRFGLEY